MGILVDNIFKSFKKRTVVNGVSLTVDNGEIVGLLGPNGAGKSTIFYMIVGLLKPDKGSISLSGEDITKLPIFKRSRLGIGYLAQESSIFRNMTVHDNIVAALEFRYSKKSEIKNRVDELVVDFNLEKVIKTYGYALSGGERRRVEIARCLATNPDFILLDEPFAGIDPISVSDIQSMVFSLKERGIGVLITDHNVRETLKITDRAYIVTDGEILVEGSSKVVLDNDEVKSRYLGDSFTL